MRRNFSHSLILPVVAALLSGCGSGVTSSPVTPPTPTPTSSPLAFYHAYGDSITYGYLLPNPATQDYPVLVGQTASLGLSNYSDDGDQSCDVPARQIFPHSDSPTTSNRGLYSILISTNDVDYKSSGAYEAVFNLCHQASIAWLALPSQYKVLGNSSAVTTTGATHLETDNNWNALTTDAKGATLNFPIQLSAAHPIYIWYRMTDGSAGTFTYSLDGSVVGSVTSATTPTISTVNGTGTSFGLLRIASAAAGAHVVAITQTSTGSSGAGIVAIGAPPASTAIDLPRVLVGTTPRQEIGSGGPCDLVPSKCAAYIADITANVNLFAGDGLDVRLFDSRKYIAGTSADMADALHPNALGDQELAHSVEDVLN